MYIRSKILVDNLLLNDKEFIINSIFGHVMYYILNLNKVTIYARELQDEYSRRKYFWRPQIRNNYGAIQ